MLPSQISAFAIGMALYFVIRQMPKMTKFFYFLAFISASVITICAVTFLQFGGPISVLTYSFIFALFALSFSGGHLALFTNKWIQTLGVQSFSAYLSQFVVIYLGVWAAEKRTAKK
jgi:peptidoglycan/LPS O-acetylase OafA/YrhL